MYYIRITYDCKIQKSTKSIKNEVINAQINKNIKVRFNFNRNKLVYVDQRKGHDKRYHTTRIKEIDFG